MTTLIRTLAKALPCTYEVYEVDSSMIVEIGYNESQQALYVQFPTATYKYLGFSREMLVELLEAESVGKHFHSIKSGLECVKM